VKIYIIQQGRQNSKELTGRVTYQTKSTNH